MVVRKIIESTLVAGSTTVTFTDTEIPNSLLRVYCTKSGLFPISQTLSGNSVTVSYKPQDSNVGVALEIVKQGLDIVDDLTSDDTTKALSANQGYVLKGLIDSIVIPTVPDKITDLSDVDVDEITAGQVLAWDAVSEKFINVDQSGGGSESYSTNETVIGTWIDGSTLYQKTIDFGQLPNATSKSVAHGISHLGVVADIDCIAQAPNDNSWCSIPRAHTATISLQISLELTDTNVVIVTATNRSAYSVCYVTIKYTKTQ